MVGAGNEELDAIDYAFTETIEHWAPSIFISIITISRVTLTSNAGSNIGKACLAKPTRLTNEGKNNVKRQMKINNCNISIWYERLTITYYIDDKIWCLCKVSNTSFW